MTQIICKGVALGYEGRIVCRGVDFGVSAGDYLCVVGDNGSGKSTLIKTLLNLVPPAEGEISLCGIDRRDIGYLPQQSDTGKDFPATVYEVVRSGCVGQRSFRFFMGKAQKETVERNMRCVKISDLAKRPFSELSGGQKQRVLLARALCAAEKILLLDEPVAGLDPRAAEDMYRAIEHLNRDHGITIIMVTHDLSAVAKYATKVLNMGDVPAFYDSARDFCDQMGISAGEEEHR